jgi:glycosyltransferase involved in cell wall biosynthesis
MNLNKVSCVMTTYRRFHCVERSIAMFLGQDYFNNELIVYNTDVDFPVSLDSTFNDVKDKIKIINNNIDFETKKPYTNVGSIRRDAMTFASGDGYITWDDDDIFFPWNIRQCLDGILRTKKFSWKPTHSFIKQRGTEPKLFYNNLEASILTYMSKIYEYGFNLQKTGAEHLGWLDKMIVNNEIAIDDYAVPGYCFYWSDPEDIGGHKQSNGNEFARPDNFERHKLYTTDFAKRPFTKTSLKDHREIFSDFIPKLQEYEKTNKELYDLYIAPNIENLL